MKRALNIFVALVMAVAMCVVAVGEISHAADQKMISSAKAKSIALKNAKLKSGKVKAMKVEFDDEDGIYEIEFIKKKNRAEYDYEIDAYNCRILKKSIDYKYRATSSKKKIGVTKARKKVAKYSKVKYSVIKKGTCKFEKKQRGSKYEVKFRKGNYEYECEVLASNGKVIEWNMEYIGR